MSTHDMAVPEQLPILGRGKHRNPRKGACFMELASYLAGERWSDHPACTHPLVATAARCVNDYTSDAARPRLARLIPSVIGLTGDDPHIDPAVALYCATAALPVVAAERQRVMAVAILSCEHVLADLDGRPDDDMQDTSREALEQVPHAYRWARRFSNDVAPEPSRFRRHAAPHIVAKAVEGVARACVPDRDERMHDMLEGAIAECRKWVSPRAQTSAPVPPERWDDACRLTTAGARI